MPDRHFHLDEDALKQALDDSLDGTAPRRDLWSDIQVAVGRPRETRSKKWVLVVAAPVAAAALVALALLGGPWRSSGPSAQAVYVTEALGSLFKVSSVYVRQETRSDNLLTGMILDGLAQSPGSAPSGPAFEYRNCTVESLVRRCTLVDKTTGERVGSSESTGGRQTTEGWYVFPGRFFVRTTQVLDAELWPELRGKGRLGQKTPTEEFLYVDGRAYTRSDQIPGDIWTISPPSPAQSRRASPDKLFWGLFENRLEGAPDVLGREFSVVEQLEETEIDGVRTRRYRASAVCGNDCSQVLDIWIGTSDGLPRKAVNEYNGGRAGSAGEGPVRTDTFTFSRFNETLELPPEPRPEEVRRFPRLTPGQ